MVEIDVAIKDNTLGMDMDAPYWVHHNGDQVGLYVDANEASRHLRRLRRSFTTPLQIKIERDKNRTALQAPLSATKCCVLYLKDKKEYRTAWFYRPDNAQRALKIMRKKYGQKNAIICLD